MVKYIYKAKKERVIIAIYREFVSGGRQIIKIIINGSGAAIFNIIDGSSVITLSVYENIK